MDVLTLVSRMRSDGSLARVANNPLAQFGTEARSYLGASLLPERLVDDNAYVEDQIMYRTIIANDGSRYSPAQIKESGAISGQFTVILGNQDIKRQFTGRDYDAFLRILGNSRQTEQAALQVLNWSDVVLNRALIELLEKQRWELIVSATTTRAGDDNYSETVPISNPSGHRVAAGGTWSSNAYDPYPDIVAMANQLATKGYTVNRIITSKKVLNILAKNTNIANKFGQRVVVVSGDVVTATQGRVTQSDLGQLFQADGLPVPETYELTYRTSSGMTRFLPDTVMVFLSTTGRDEPVIVDTNLEVIPDTFGYTAIGRAVGQSGPGRVIRLFPHDDKPPRIVGEAWQTGFPVITEPEAIGVITSIG